MLAFSCGTSTGAGFLDLTANRVLPESADPHLPLHDVRFDARGRVVADAFDASGAAVTRCQWLSWDPAGGPPAVLAADRPGESAAFYLAPDGRRYALIDDDRIELVDAATRRRLAAAAVPRDPEGSSGVTDCVWAPDASAFAVTAGPKTVVLSVESGLGHVTGAFAGFPGGPTFRTAAGSRRQIAATAVETWSLPGVTVVSCDAAGGDRKAVRIDNFELTGRADRAGRYAGKFDPRGKLGTGRPKFQLRGAEAGEVVWEVSEPAGPGWYGPPVPSPDGRTVAVPRTERLAELAGTVEFHEAYTGGLRRTLAFETEADRMAFDRRGRTLLTCHPTAPIFLWDVYGERTAPLPPPDAAGWDGVWADLASADAAAGYRAVCAMVQHPEGAVPALRARQAAQPAPPAERVRALAEQLGSPRYHLRAAADKELAARADDSRADLAEALKACTRPEAKARLETLLANAGRPVPSTIRSMRMVEGLEAAGIPAARALLAEWATGPPARVLSREALSALDRWDV